MFHTCNLTIDYNRKITSLGITPTDFCYDLMNKKISSFAAHPKKIVVYFLNSADVDEREMKSISEISVYWNLLSPHYRGDQVNKRFILGRWLAFHLLQTFGGTENEFKEMKLTSFGKPVLPKHPVSFNIAHSGDLLVCAASLSNVGIDVEHLRPIDWKEYRSCFSPSEWYEISGATNPAFEVLQRWVQKESLLKADGRGLQVPMASVDLRKDVGKISDEDTLWYLHPLKISNDYTCCVCTDVPDPEISVQQIAL
ncbi:hypothetical protein WSM22_39950 [Cytophagales bacterium WSM2-2]|nr:hypothetical protein WSM22_39950 [Cytophagales bacterium WSM2-2]